MRFKADYNYKNRIEEFCNKYKNFTPVFDLNSVIDIGFELGNNEVLITRSNTITEGKDIYRYKQIKKIVCFSDGLLVMFKGNKFIFLPVTDNENTDEDLIYIARVFYENMKGRFHVHSRLYVINYSSDIQKRKRITFRFSDLPIVPTVLSVILILFGLVFSTMPSSYIPVSREKCVVYTGEYESFEKDEDDYMYIYFKNGDEQWVDCSCYSSKLYTKMAALKEGDKLEILLHPDNEYVVELVCDGEEFLNLDFAQKAMYEDIEGMDYFGYVVVLVGVLVLIYGISRFVAERPKNRYDGELI